MTLDEILQDIHGLDERLRALEQRYSLLSEDLYTLYRLGELEQSRDLIRWVGYYELRQERQRAYAAALRERLLHPLVASVDTTPMDAGPDGVSADLQPLARIGERGADWPRKQAIWTALGQVPEDQFSSVEASLVDMGYIYDVRTRGGDVHVVMTMPHRGRPKYDFLAKPLRARLEQMPGVASVIVDLTWEPA